MNQRGRKSASALALSTAHVGSVAVLEPPAGLSQAERGVWKGMVDSKPADFFGMEHVPLMVEYCRNVCRGHVIDQQIQGFDADLMATEDGFRRYKDLIGLSTKVAGVVKMYATAMRLTQQSEYQRDKARAPRPKQNLWEREPKAERLAA